VQTHLTPAEDDRIMVEDPGTPVDTGRPTTVPDSVMTGLPAGVADLLTRNDAGLVPAVVQQYDTGEVLMLAWMDDEALALTLSTGRATYFSRSRGMLWVKGETSGHRQYVRSVELDCDGDALLVRVDQVGPACHTGERTCFHTRLSGELA
jgi:phosphoribosyl-AMP cyclohydrolase